MASRHLSIVKWKFFILPIGFGKKSPPIDSLSSYKITKKIFTKENSKNHARFYVILNFPDENIFPSGKEWIFELTDALGGWRITDLYQAERGNIQTGL